jgi:ATP citrate (pro-S)-lyase
MARKKIREYDAKRLLNKYLAELSGITLNLEPVQVTIGTDFEKLKKQHPWLVKERLVVKPDMLFGKRGKSNLLLLDADFGGAKKFLKEKLGKEQEITGVNGTLTHFIIERFVPHKEEYYLSIMTGREADTINFSTMGGIEVEANWDRVAHLEVPVGKQTDEKKLEHALNGVPEEKKKPLSAFITAAYKVFIELDFTFMEFNPFTFKTGDTGQETGNRKPATVVPLDMRGELDDTASFKNQKKWEGLEFPKAFGRKLYPEEEAVEEMDEKTGASLKLTILNPKGRIWTMVAGGGASVIYTDTIADLGMGSELGNYGEYSGDPNEEETYQYAKTLLDLATRNPDGKPRALLIGGGIANFTDVANTFKGIIHALRDYKEKIKKADMRVYVRRGGPNYQTGLKMMKELGKELGVPIEVFGPETNMTKIVPMAMDYVKKE